MILKKCAKLRNNENPAHIKKVFFTPDLTPGELELNKKLRADLKEKNKDKNLYRIKNGKIVLREAGNIACPVTLDNYNVPSLNSAVHLIPKENKLNYVTHSTNQTSLSSLSDKYNYKPKLLNLLSLNTQSLTAKRSPLVI